MAQLSKVLKAVCWAGSVKEFVLVVFLCAVFVVCDSEACV